MKTKSAHSFVPRIIAIAVVFLILKYAGWLPVALLLLLLTVTAVDGAAEKISVLTRIPKRLCALAIIVLAIIFTGTVGIIAVSALISECRELLLSLSDGRGRLMILIDSLLCRVETLQGIFSPFFHKDLGYLWDSIHSLINRGTAHLLTEAGRWAAALIGKTPSIIGISVFFTVSAIWLSIDLDGIRRELQQVLPVEMGERLISFVGKARRLCAEYALSHIILFAITFAETYIGLLVMGVPFSLALSVLVAIVDILPLLGASAVLLPTAAVAAVTGNYGLCFGILALLGVLYITRQVTEPYVVGRRIGIHPFLSFVSTFSGLALFGPSGAIILPLLVSLLIGTDDRCSPLR